MLLSHTSTLKPTLSLAQVSLAILRACKPEWVAGTLSDLLPGVSLEWLSRLKARLQPQFEELVEEATRRGRPKKPEDPSGEIEKLTALLQVAAATISEIGVRKSRPKRNLLAAWERLKKKYGMSLREFCASLGLKERTFRHWRAHPPDPQLSLFEPPQENKPKAKNEGRFSLDLTAPGVQLMADTSDWDLFGVPLKIMASMDPGLRKRDLWKAFDVKIEESSQAIVKTLSGLDLEGLQILTDQGTPYLSDLAKEEYERMGIEHEPQKEGAPTEKAPLERSFRTVKEALQPITRLTNKLSEMIPALKNSRLAASLGKLLIVLFLKVYLEGRAHLAHPLEGKDPQVLEAIVEDQRERARAEDRSKRLLLQAIHSEYAMEGSRDAFVRNLRGHALEDIQEAERRLRPKACRCVVRKCARYFAGILRNVAEDGRARRKRLRAERIKRGEEKKKVETVMAQRAFLQEHPLEAISKGLDLQALWWDPVKGEMVLGKNWGPAHGYLKLAFKKIQEENPLGAADEIQAAFKVWEERRKDLDPDVVQEVGRVFVRVVSESPFPQPTIKDLTRAILGERIHPPARKTSTRRPHPGPDLRI